MSVWKQNEDVAYVVNQHRACLLDLTRPDQLPIVLEGSARSVYDTIDGTRDTDAIIEHLGAMFPDVVHLPRQVKDCLADLARSGLIRLG